MRGLSIFRLAVLLAVMAVAACGTVLDVQPDDPPASGTEGGATIDGPVGDAPAPFEDFEAGDASTACALSVDRKTIAFGDVITGTTKNEVVTITSVASDPVTVAIAVTGTSFDSVETSVVVPSNSSSTFTVSFTGTVVGTLSGKATLTWDGCSVVIPLSAKTLAAGSVAISPATLNLGAVACGSTPPAGNIAVDSAITIGWNATITPGPFNVPSNGTITPGTTLITVGADPLVPKEDPKEFAADVSLFIGADAGPRIVHVTATSLGGKLAFTPNDVTLTKTAPSRTVALTNTGTQAVQVLLAIDPPFKIVEAAKGTQKVTILPNQSQAVTISSAAVGPAVRTATVTQNAGTLCFAGPLTVRQ